MRSRNFVVFLWLIGFTLVLFSTFPAMAYEPLMGTQLALRGTSADDAEAAVDDEVPKKVATQEEKKSSSESHSQGIEQEVKELRQEIEKIRSENEARKRLEVPEEEKSQSVEDILSAAGRQYSLLKKGTIALSYAFNYSYYSGDVISAATIVERRSNHNLTNTVSAEYALFNNLTLSTNIPFAYKYNAVGTSSAQQATDFGDISLGFTFQPFKAGGNIPPTIFSLGVSLPTGSSPYKINLNNSLPTGAGHYSFSGGVSMSKVLDPLVAFGSLSYSYSMPESDLNQYWNKSERLTRVEPGSSLGLSFGFGYALSYQASLNMSAQFSYNFTNKYTVNDNYTSESGTTLASSFNVGTGWRITPARSLYVSVSIGLTNNDPDVSLSVKLPFEF